MSEQKDQQWAINEMANWLASPNRIWREANRGTMVVPFVKTEMGQF